MLKTTAIRFACSNNSADAGGIIGDAALRLNELIPQQGRYRVGVDAAASQFFTLLGPQSGVLTNCHGRPPNAGGLGYRVQFHRHAPMETGNISTMSAIAFTNTLASSAAVRAP